MNPIAGMLHGLTWLLMLGSLIPSAAAEAPRRVVSLDLCSDWMLLAYADPRQVAGFSPYLHQFDSGRVEPGLPIHDGSLEQVLALQPDLIVTGEFNALLLRERLQQLGVRVAVLPNPRRLGDIEAYISRVKSLVGDDTDGPEIVNDIAASHPARGDRLLLLGANGIGIGQATLEHDLITAAGWVNYIADSGFVTLQLERLIADPPDAIFLSSSRGQSLADRFASHPALRKRIANTRWKTDSGWRWTCPGPWTYRLIEELSAWKGH